MRTRGAKNMQYKIRLLTKNNRTGDTYGISIPKSIAENFKNCYFRIELKDNSILLISGTHIKDEAAKEDFEDYTVKKEKILKV